MLGLILRQFICWVGEEGGPEASLETLSRAGYGKDHVFRMGVAYPNERWRILFEAAGEILGLSARRCERRFAASFLSDAKRRFPVWFSMATSARDLLERQPRIHNTLATALADPAERSDVTEKFAVTAEANGLLVHYRSPNRLCGFYVALAELVLDDFGETAVIHHAHCMRRGDSACEIRIEWFDEVEP